MASAQSIIIAAMQEIGAIALSETAVPDDLVAMGLLGFNRRISQWNTRRPFGSYEYTEVFTLPTSENSFNIGAAADFPDIVITGGIAPNQIDSAKRVTSDVPPVETPIPVLTFQQWDALRIPGLITNLTVAVYLQTLPKLPLLWCYGFEAGQKLRLSWRNIMASVAVGAIATTIDFQDGYEDALILTLAEDLSGPFQKPITPDLMRRARESRLNIMGLNGKPEVIASDYQTKGRPGYSVADFYARNI